MDQAKKRARIPRPPPVRDDSSSSLSGLERTIPTFKSFVKAVAPTPDGPRATAHQDRKRRQRSLEESATKPLPPVPSEAVEKPAVESPPPVTLPARSSSVYSYRASLWEAPRVTGITNSENPLQDGLQHPIFAASSPQLAGKEPELPAPLEPRVYVPSIPGYPQCPSPDPLFMRDLKSPMFMGPGPTILTDGSTPESWSSKATTPPTEPHIPRQSPREAHPLGLVTGTPEGSTKQLDYFTRRTVPSPLSAKPLEPPMGAQFPPDLAPEDEKNQSVEAGSDLDEDSARNRDDSTHRGRTYTRKAPPMSREHGHCIQSGRRVHISPAKLGRDSSGAATPASVDDEDEGLASEPQVDPAKEYHRLLTDQYHDLVAHPLGQQGWSPDETDDEQQARDIRLVPAPLFWRRGSRKSDDVSKLVALQRTSELGHKKKESTSTVRGRLPSLSSFPLKLSLPSQYPRKEGARSRSNSNQYPTPTTPVHDLSYGLPNSSLVVDNPSSWFRNNDNKDRASPKTHHHFSSFQFSKSSKKNQQTPPHVPPLPLKLATSFSTGRTSADDSNTGKKARFTSKIPRPKPGTPPSAGGARSAHQRRAASAASPRRHPTTPDTSPDARQSPTTQPSRRRSITGAGPAARALAAGMHVVFEKTRSSLHAAAGALATPPASPTDISPTTAPALPIPPSAPSSSATATTAPTPAKEAPPAPRPRAASTLPFVHDPRRPSARDSDDDGHGPGEGWRGVGGGRRRSSSLRARATEARREAAREKRREELKRSIRLVGRTDPNVVAGYVRDAAPVPARASGWVGVPTGPRWV